MREIHFGPPVYKTLTLTEADDSDAETTVATKDTS